MTSLASASLARNGFLSRNVRNAGDFIAHAAGIRSIWVSDGYRIVWIVGQRWKGRLNVEGLLRMETNVYMLKGD